jgi:hypothetical protein
VEICLPYPHADTFLGIPPQIHQGSLIAKSRFLHQSCITLGFASEITWTLDALVDDVVHWLHKPNASRTSKVGTLSSNQFLGLVNSFIDGEASSEFQRMVYAISLSYTQQTALDKHYLSVMELSQIGAMAGHSFLKFLDRRLTPEHLKNSSKSGLQCLFLLIVGTTLSVGYSRPIPVQPVRIPNHNYSCSIIDRCFRIGASQLRVNSIQ